MPSQPDTPAVEDLQTQISIIIQRVVLLLTLSPAIVSYRQIPWAPSGNFAPTGQRTEGEVEANYSKFRFVGGQKA